jgi:hypothetical protein
LSEQSYDLEASREDCSRRTVTRGALSLRLAMHRLAMSWREARLLPTVRTSEYRLDNLQYLVRVRPSARSGHPGTRGASSAPRK